MVTSYKNEGNFTRLVKKYYKIIFEEKYSISKSNALLYCDSLLNIHKTNSTIKAFALYSKGFTYSRLGNYSKAEEYMNSSFIEIEKIEIEKIKYNQKLQALYYYALHLLTVQNVDVANTVINQGIELAKKTKNALMLINFKNLIGRSYSLIGLNKRAIENGKKTIKEITKLKNNFDKKQYNNMLIKAYLNTANRNLNFFLSDSIQNKAYVDSTNFQLLNLNKFISNNKIKITIHQNRRISNLEADIFFYKKDYKNAIDKYYKVLDLLKNNKFKKRSYQVKFKIAESYFLLKNYEKALKLFSKLDNSDLMQYNLLKNSVLIKYYYAQIYLKTGNTVKALKYTDTFNNQISKYYKMMSDKKINVFTANELKIKERILNNLMFQKKMNNNLTSYIIVICSVVLVVFIGGFIYVEKQKNKFKKKVSSLDNYINTLRQERAKEIAKKIPEYKAEIILTKLKAIEAENLFISKDYSLSKVSKRINSNSAYVSYVVNTYLKKSFAQYTNELRVNYALLKLDSDMVYKKYTLIAIAESVGYKSLATFNKNFRAITGITPKQYLKHLNSSSD